MDSWLRLGSEAFAESLVRGRAESGTESKDILFGLFTGERSTATLRGPLVALCRMDVSPINSLLAWGDS